MTERDDTDLDAALRGLRHTRPSGDLMDRIAGDATLEQAFRAARRDAPVPSDMLMARIARDARRHRPSAWWDRAAWSGLAVAGIAGLMIGLSGGADGLVGSEEELGTLTMAYDFQFAALE